MEDNKNISKALVEFHKVVSGRVGFDSINPYFKSKYASLGAVIDHINKNAPKFGLGWVQLPVSDPTMNMVGVRTTVIHKSGETITSEILMPYNTVMTKLNKDGEAIRFELETSKLAQEIGSVISYLRRYALASVFGLYADEDNDANPAEPVAEMVGMKVAPKVETKSKAQRPYKPEVLVSNLKKMAAKSEPASQLDRQTLVAALAQIIGDDDNIRHSVQQYLFGHASIKDVPAEMISAGLAWLSPEYSKEQKTYYLTPYAVEELNLVLDEALQA